MDNRKNNNWNNKPSEFPEITKPLHMHYIDPVQLYLPNGLAYKYAVKFRGIKNHQMRKVLDGVKDALATTSLDEAKKKIFVLVAMSAYNAGRMKEMKSLYEFIHQTINEKSIQTIEDIKTFDQLFTSIVAYHKTVSRS